jgi:hypothetical protein
MSNTNIVKVDGFEFQYRDDEYINLTKMCKQVNKELKSYLRLSSTKTFLKIVEVEVQKQNHGIPILEKRIGGISTKQGTYGHPLVAIHLAQWLSDEFALAVAKLTQSYLKADITLAQDILTRTSTNQINDKGASIASTIIDKANDKTIEHIQARLHTKQTNKELNKALSECPNVTRKVYPMAQDSIYKATYGRTITTLKNQKGLTKQDSLRDTLSTDELVHLSFCELMTSKVLNRTKPNGDINCTNSVYQTAKKIKLFEESLLTGII